MNKKDILLQLGGIEKKTGVKLPNYYKEHMANTVGEKDDHEVIDAQGNIVSIYNYKDVLERNITYAINDVVKDYFLIGQDSDVGYFIKTDCNDSAIYSVDLGALGILEMEKEIKNLDQLEVVT